jgi:uncharacterized membrane protein
MNRPKFTWGPVAQGIYIAMIWCTFVVSWHAPHLMLEYVLFLVFVGVFLRPILEKLGLVDLVSFLACRADDKRWRKIEEQRCMEVRRERHAIKHRSRRSANPDLPKNW